MPEKISQTIIAKALAESKTTSDRLVAAKYNISLSSLRRYRRRLGVSPLAAEVQSYLNKPVEPDWLDRVPGALSSAIDFLERASSELDPSSYRAVDSVIKAVSVLNEAGLTARVVEQRLSGK